MSVFIYSVLVALAYALVGKLSLFLAVLPGDASPVWPAAGIALAAALLGGWRMFPAIWLGAFFANLRLDNLASTPDVLMAVGACTGAALQANLGAWLIARLQRGDTRLPVRDGQLIRFMLLAGPVVCLLSPTVGMSSLLLGGRIDLVDLPYGWVAWWVGDSIGTMLLAPLMLIFFRHVQDDLELPRVGTIVPPLLAMALVASGFFWVHQAELKRGRAMFHQQAEILSEQLQWRLKEATNAFRGVQGLFMASSEVTESEFRVFTSREPLHLLSLESLLWALPEPAVSGREGALSHRFRVKFQYPSAGAGQQIGQPLESEANLIHALARISQTGEATVFATSASAGSPNAIAGWLLPVIKGGTLQGVLLGRLRVAEMVDDLLAKQDRRDISVYIELHGGEQLFGERLTQYFAAHQTGLQLEDRHWSFTVYADLDYVRGMDLSASYVTLLGGMLVTCLLSLFCIVINVRAAHVRRLVEVRTADLKREMQRAEEASRAKSLFLASMSHELRTPLNAVIGFSAHLLKGASAQLSQRQVDALSSIERNGRYLLRIVSDVLDIAQIETGCMSISVDEVAVHEVLSDVELQMRGLMEAKGLSFAVGAASPGLVLLADKQRLMQLLLNLVANALKFTEQGSVVVTADACVRGGRSGVQFSVVDTGIGLTKEQQHRLQKPFSSIDSRVSGRIEGAGLGLALVREIAELHGGVMWVDSVEGQGGRFHVWLPSWPECVLDAL